MDLLKDFSLAKKQRTCAEATQQRIDAVLGQLAQTRAALVAQQQSTATATALLAATLADSQAQSLDAHKDLHSAMAKFTKALDKRFKPVDMDHVWDPQALKGADKQSVLHRALVLHLVREGRFDLAKTFARESMLKDYTPDSFTSEFADMYTILNSIKLYDLSHVISWVESRVALLESIESDLYFHVVKLQFLKLLFGIDGVFEGSRDAALAYAKEKFGLFQALHLKEIQKLMGSLLYTNKTNTSSPYKNLTSTTHLWNDLSHKFTRDFCLLLHLPAESPLHTCVSVGVSALPTIIKMSSILKEQSGLEWSQQGELPVEMPLLDRQRFHSIFTCPVSKELGTKENPPMMMVCGHVICKESLLRLGKGSLTTKFKCPYCPSESKGEQAVMIQF